MADEIATGYAASNEGGSGAGAVIFSPTVDPLVNLNHNLDELSKDQDGIIAQRQLHVQQNAKFLSALNPDLNGIFPGDKDALVKKANDLQQMGVNYLGQGGRNPQSQSEIDRAQNELKGAIAVSKARNISIAEGVKQYQANPEKYDGDETNKNLGKLAAIPLDHLGADDFSKPALVPKPPDVMTSLVNEVAKIPDEESQSGKEKTLASGRVGLETVKQKDPKQVLGVVSALYNANTQRVQKAFNDLPPEEQAGWKVAGDLTGGLSAKAWYMQKGIDAAGGKQVTYKDVSYDPLRTKAFELQREKEKDIDPTIYRLANIIKGKGDPDDITISLPAPLPGQVPDPNASFYSGAKINMLNTGRSLGVFQIEMPAPTATDPDKTKLETPENIHMMFANFGGKQYAMNTQSVYAYAKGKGIPAEDVINNINQYKNDIGLYQPVDDTYLGRFYNGAKGVEGNAQMKTFTNTVNSRGAFENGRVNLEKLGGGNSSTPATISYKVGNDVYNIPSDKSAGFLKQYPNAVKQ